MLKALEDRERAAESLFVQSESARFAAHCAEIRALATFAMAQLGVDGRTAEAYARVLIAAMIDGTSDADLIARVRADLGANGVALTDGVLRSAMLRGGAADVAPR